ncbi:MAG: sigma-70 family RNA polymerase sigma factor [Flavobacteriales bacterium]|nr:sigma-70 family RNA polymerase sigma factor [Flavobacteriales bacterium]
MFFRKKQITGESDEEIVKKYSSVGDPSLVGVLYERHAHLVFAVCMKYLKNTEESRDAVLNIFEKLMHDLKLHSIENFKSWLHSVARNHCLMLLRKSNNQGKEKDIDELEHLLEEQQEEIQLTEDLLNQLPDAINQLNPEQKTCIELFYLQDKSYQEVADITGFDLNKVKSHIQNGKRNLKILLSKSHETNF